MRASVFDTLEYVETLRKGGMNQQEAEAITRATARAITQAFDHYDFVTKKDMEPIKTDIIDIKQTMIAMQSEMKSMRSDFQKDILAMEYNFDQKMVSIELSLKTFFVRSLLTTVGLIGSVMAIVRYWPTS